MSTQELLADHRSVLPEKLNHLAACRVCALVKDRQMFESEGCNNCTHTQPTIWNAGEFLEMTTPIFSGYAITAYFSLPGLKNANF